MKSDNSIQSILKNTDVRLKLLTRHIELLSIANILIKSALEEPLKSQISPLKIQGAILTLGAKNATIATQCRLLAPELLKTIQSHPQFKTIVAIQCKVSQPPQDLPQKVQPLRSKTLSLKTKQHLQQFAQQIEDEGLKESLKKLSAIEKA